MCGGSGVRLWPYTKVLPKPLMPLPDGAVLDRLLAALGRSGFRRVAITTGYLGDIVEAFAGDGRKWGLHVDCVRESHPLGTVGGLRSIEDLAENFLILNGDIVTDLDFGGLLQAHVRRQTDATIAVQERDLRESYGVVTVGEGDIVTGYSEKPVTPRQVSVGAYALRRGAVQLIPTHSYMDFPEFVLRLLSDGREVSAYRFSGFWKDVGSEVDYKEAVQMVQQLSQGDSGQRGPEAHCRK